MERKSGIVYISRIPPHMNPLKIQRIFSRYGQINRIFLQPIGYSLMINIRNSTEIVRSKRIHETKLYSEGWIEFKKKKIAKSVAFSLNNTKIGRKNRGYYDHDFWNLKYLRKFRWSHLNEKAAHHNVIREQRLRTEISWMKKQNTAFLDNLDKSRAIDAIVKRKESIGSEHVKVSLLRLSSCSK
ncbi:uncharacterized protein TRIADDRAFT_33041 [Trichoplax adhaerens]|uniref:Activator of basal transcription 1 n=1 Tax=Trichoplax adhaerens TaxID=10228 RepID=B3SBY6_TRIAD|nr:hypothetical protein TRIADDRAFT_33041 [Trichoplax adhaerens]EDV19713.1 hypothetical protein TRIADDRAFT_33041 [Trichoplax adhaerens]|eukprot:XP_002117737.1 hypothetical protein TRIADDRAFT_33041 [Trichoplax adhaerens]